MRQLRYSVLLLLCVGCWLGVFPLQAAEAPEANPGAMLPRLFAATVAVQVYDADQQLLCTGAGCVVTLPQAHGAPLCGVVTCRHLFVGAARGELRTMNGITLPVTDVLGEDRDSDLVLLAAAWPPGLTAVTVATTLPADKTPVLLVSPAQTVLKSTLTEREEAAFDEMTCAVPSAFIGSPLVNASGIVLGLAALPLHEGPKSANLAIPALRLGALRRATPLPLADWAAHLPVRWFLSAEGQWYQLRGWLAAGDNEQACAHLETVAIIEQETTEVQLYRGICRFEDEDYPAALTMLRKVVAKEPTCIAAQAYLGATYLQLHREAEAVAPLTEAVRLSANDEPALANLGSCYVTLQRNAEAVPPLQAAVRLKPDDAWAQMHLGDAFFALHRYAEAVPPFTAAVRLCPEDEWSDALLGACYVNLGRATDALTVLKEALRQNPNDAFARCYFSLAQQLQQIEGARRVMRQAIEGMQQLLKN